ncbi:MAG: hypothetical protein WC907_05790 [Acholeplasmataceae bacterium]
MRKLFIYVLLIFSVFLVSCSNNETVKDTFLFEVKDIAGDVLFTKEIIYHDDLGVFESILEVVEVDYDTSEYGAFINGVEDFYPTDYGNSFDYFFSLYVNDEMSMIGIDQVTYSDNLKISLIETFYDSSQTYETFLFEVIDLDDNEILSKTINYDSDLGVFESILEVVEVDYDTSEYGAFINGVEDFYPTENGVSYNYYLSVLVNDEYSDTGIDQILYEENLKITLKETTTLDPFDLLVDSFINDFIINESNKFINDSKTDQYVLASLVKLNSYGYYNIDFSDYDFEDFELSGVKDYLLQSLKNNALGNEFTEAELVEINDLSSTNLYEVTTILNILDSVYGKAELNLRNDLLDTLITTNNPYMDPDYAGMTLQAVSTFKDDNDVETFKDDMVTYLKDNQNEDGFISYEIANASSTAQGILGLLAIGLNPRDEEFVKNDYDLVESLMKYYSDGGFKYKLSDENIDLMFSTPQAFSALAMYKIYRDQYSFSGGLVNLWSSN